MTPRVLAVVGPTATGKSDLALALAQRLGGEIVNADSMQLYRGMDIGTAKTPPARRGGITHHLLDCWDVTRTASVADYQLDARAVVDELLASGVTPVVVGGSGLYVRAALDVLEFPGTDPQLRAGLEAELLASGSGVLHERLQVVDPAAAAVIPAANGRRVVRALEVVSLTGRPYRAALPDYRSAYDVVHVGLDRDTAALDARIGTRVSTMVGAGLLEEVRALDAAGIRSGTTASRALGYAPMLSVLDGVMTLDAAVERTVATTRRYVRRQRSWFRRDPRIRWVDAALPPTELLDMVTDWTRGATMEA